MYTRTISLNSVDKIKKMQEILRDYEFDADIKHERNLVDAKSFMGVISLDLSNPVTLILHTDDAYVATEILNRMEVNDIC